jgi:hypothetical protein
MKVFLRKRKMMKNRVRLSLRIINNMVEIIRRIHL